jgi:hypothetical protein
MIQKIFHTVIAVVAFISLTAMAGSSGFERTPKVEKNYAIVITDTAGNKIDGGQFSWEGHLYFGGHVGMAQVMIPFDKVNELNAEETSNGTVKATLHLADGSQMILKIDANTHCYGEAGFGSFMFSMKEINKIVFKQNK